MKIDHVGEKNNDKEILPSNILTENQPTGILSKIKDRGQLIAYVKLFRLE